tara:strand:- start:42 stop:233 length:192 start_codon:yes stop_codon:yes gene_type:complete
MAITYSEDGKKKIRNGNKKAIALNAGPSTPVGVYDTADGGKMVMPKLQPFKIRKIKKGGLPPV